MIITRRVEEAMHIGDKITIQVSRIKGNRVALAIDAAEDVKVLREELDPHPEDDESATAEESGDEAQELPSQ
nr:carbon storage regulator [Halorhodospira sp. 9621]